MFTGDQLNAALGLIGWSRSKLALEAGVSKNTIDRAATAGPNVPSQSGTNLNKIELALESNGVMFLDAHDIANGRGVCLKVDLKT